MRGNILNSNENWGKWSKNDWNSWIEQKLDERQRVYEISPDELIASYNRENNYSKDYHGRELFELIQNADDSGIGYKGKSKLLLKLTKHALYIANSGACFNPKGFISLILGDISPKLAQGIKYIGYKGLGFRSILGWTSLIGIMSGKASIGFSRKFASQFLHNLKELNPSIMERVNEFTINSRIDNPIATFSAPFTLLGRNNKELDDRYLKQMNMLLQIGYDTVIFLKFSSPRKVFPQVEEQLLAINSETLLFLQHLERLEIDVMDKNRSWDVDRRKIKKIKIIPPVGQVESWTVFTEKGPIPSKYLSKDQTSLDKYEMKLAIPEIGKVLSGKLFVYFPTNVMFPLRAIAHATFDSTSNRQNLPPSDINKYVAKKLAKFIARSGVNILNPNDPWSTIEYLIPYSEFGPDLTDLEFDRILIEELRSAPIFPTMRGGFKPATKLKRLRGNFNKVLAKNYFSDICLHTDDDNVYDKLNIEFLDYEDLVTRLNQIGKSLSMKDRADLIYLLNEGYKYYSDTTRPNLLIDEGGTIIIGSDIAILPPDEKQFSLPPWVPLRIINSQLINHLKELYNVSTVRDLRHKLPLFKVQEYNLASIFSVIVSETNKRIKSNSDKDSYYRKEMIHVLWDLYNSLGEEIKIPDKVTISLPTRNNSIRSADELYFGKEYNKGQMLENLYSRIDENLFVGSPKQLGIKNPLDTTEYFLSWLGVADRPRYIRKEVLDSKYKDYVISHLDTPIQIENTIVKSKDDLRRNCRGNVKNVKSIDHLEEILIKAEPEAVLCMLAFETQMNEWRINGDTEARLEYLGYNMRVTRNLTNKPIFSYPLWLLMTMKWLPTISGNRMAPIACSTAKVARDLSPLIGFPAFDQQHSIFKTFKLDRNAILYTLSQIGVSSDIDDLPWDVFYTVLLKIPQLDPEGSDARAYYKLLISRTEIDEPAACGKPFEEFMNSGTMLGTKLGEEDYYPINNLYYVENNTLPDHITENYPLVAIDRRRGAQKVLKLFGIKQLTLDDIDITITDVIKHPFNDLFQSDLERLIPYIYALRVDEDLSQRDLRALKKLHIILCRSLSATITVDEKKLNVTIKSGKSVPDNNIAYLVSDLVDMNTKILKDHLIADALGEIITNIFRVDVGGNIASLMTCPGNEREQLLDRFVGGSANDRLLRARNLLNNELEDTIEFIPAPATESFPPNSQSEEKDLIKDDVKINDPDISVDDVGDVIVTEKNHVPQEIRTIPVRISVTSKKRGQKNSGTPVNPIRSENLAIKFEEVQGRFPLMVSHLQGFEMFGCDIVSFNTEEDYNIFKDGNNINLIDRFIEVKGSSSPTGSITLKGNELQRAGQSLDKYYLYRIYEVREGEFELIELNDPCDEEIAGAPQFVVNLFQSENSKMWEVQEIELSGNKK